MVTVTAVAAAPASNESSRSPFSPVVAAPSLPTLASSPPPLVDATAPIVLAKQALPAPWELRVPNGDEECGTTSSLEVTSRAAALAGRLTVVTPVPSTTSNGDAEEAALMSEVTTPAESEVEGPWSSTSSSPVEDIVDAGPPAAAMPPDDAVSASADTADAAAALSSPADEEAAAAAFDAGFEEEDPSDTSSAEDAVFALLALQRRVPSPAPPMVTTPAMTAPPAAAFAHRSSFAHRSLPTSAPPPTHITGQKRRAFEVAPFAGPPSGRPSPVPKPDSACGEFKYICKYDGCGKSYASTDAVRKHCRQRHYDWLRQLGHGCPALYCRWEAAE